MLCMTLTRQNMQRHESDVQKFVLSVASIILRRPTNHFFAQK